MLALLQGGRSEALALCAALFLTACDDWPLYLHIEPDRPPVRVSVVINLLEDVTVVDDQIQELAPMPYPSVARIRGAISSCGFDPGQGGFTWPVHFVEGDDGSELRQAEGWFAGDVDYYSLALEQRGWLSVTLEWDNLPGEGGNAAYLPDEPEELWFGESDLDFVVFDASSLVLGQIVNDDGFSTAYPEVLERPLAVDPSSPMIIAVACHHQQPSGYTLSLRLASP